MTFQMAAVPEGWQVAGAAPSYKPGSGRELRAAG